ncbi:hypothetical protein N7467_008240 [Penicillium canescens]|nr:hypothetical protein N7467_008240 [Penicillium canescens]
MKTFGEVFYRTSQFAYESKPEYAWIYLRRRLDRSYPISEARLRIIFLEYKLVEERLRTGSRQIAHLSEHQNRRGGHWALNNQNTSSSHTNKPTENQSTKNQIRQAQLDSFPFIVPQSQNRAATFYTSVQKPPPAKPTSTQKAPPTNPASTQKPPPAKPLSARSLQDSLLASSANPLKRESLNPGDSPRASQRVRLSLPGNSRRKPWDSREGGQRLSVPEGGTVRSQSFLPQPIEQPTSPALSSDSQVPEGEWYWYEKEIGRLRELLLRPPLPPPKEIAIEDWPYREWELPSHITGSIRVPTKVSYADLQRARLAASTTSYVTGSRRVLQPSQSPQASRIPAPTFSTTLTVRSSSSSLGTPRLPAGLRKDNADTVMQGTDAETAIKIESDSSPEPQMVNVNRSNQNRGPEDEFPADMDWDPYSNSPKPGNE